MTRLRLSKLFFYILLILMPFQINKVFFTDNSFYFGFYAFYNTIFIYLTDLLIFSLILAWIWEKVWEFSRENIYSGGPWASLGTFVKRVINRISSDALYLFTSAFWLILATSLIFSRENTLGLYGLAKITEFLLLFAYVRENIDVSPRPTFDQPNFSRENKSLAKVKRGERENMIIFWLILATACIQSLLAIYQYLSQASVGFTILGEEFLRPGIKGVAKFATHGIANPLLYEFFPNLSAISDTSVVIRGYGTFPHPNVLAGFLFMGILASLYLLYFSREKLFSALALIIVSTGLVVTFSRLAWGVTFLAVVGFFGIVFFKYRRRQTQDIRSLQLERASKNLYFPGRASLILVIFLIAFGLNLFLFSTQIKDRLTGQDIKNVENSENYVDRKTYGKVAWNMFKANPIFGTGLRNFVAEMDDYSEERLLPYQHQPVHNIYLLTLAEAGILALLTLILLLLNIVRRALINKKSPAGEMLLIVFFGFLILGLFDHYFISIHQGGLMFWLVAGLLVKPVTA